MDIITRAQGFATDWHGDTMRKFSKVKYITHPQSVAYIIAYHGGSNNEIAAAWLHDTIEDTDATLEMIRDEFNEDVAYMVDGMTKPEIDGNRATRKLAMHEKLGSFDGRVHTLKAADRLHNLGTMIKYDPDFAKLYVRESIDMATYITKADAILFNKLMIALTNNARRLNVV